ncbi:myo-inositol catabolism protein IolI [Paenibacillus terrae HPL-003]|uniref:Myo-inositol catabolism protein IolI n=1 Tax=Paenibacillus terrae (strain HPL-003) TaxID=985665 RepID=G7VWB8_PAETH|nr:2-keto-myo-inositol isomerase [Paenibacillus terrae]AET59319.1 myo-inositol catabolism protein IolI [Paenibacillus terrae HPL-003]
MKLCFNQATTLNNSNLVKDLEYCEKYGYDYIEIRTMDKLPEYLKDHSIDDLVQYFQSNHIKPLAFNALVFFNNRDEAEYQALLDEYRQMLDTGSRLGVEYIVVVPLVTEKKITHADIKASSVKVLRELSDLAKPYGIKIAVEFVGHPQCTVNTFGQAYDIVEEVARDNVGLVLDCFHFHAMGSKREDLLRSDVSKIFIVHIDDTEDFPIGFLTDEDRVWPGLGAIDLDFIFATLKEKGYDHVVSVELFRPEYYELDAEEAIRTAKETTLQVVSRHYNFQLS